MSNVNLPSTGKNGFENLQNNNNARDKQECCILL